MSTYALTALLVAAGMLYAVWPLLRHHPAPPVAAEPAPDSAGELDEIRLDLAAGLLSEDEAAQRRRELERR